MESPPPPGVRYTINVGPGDSGVRISLRRRLPDGGLGDVLGMLLSWDATAVRVARKDGTVVSVAPEDVVAAKRIPPPPARRR